MELINWLGFVSFSWQQINLHHWPTSHSQILYLRNIEENNFRQKICDFFFISITRFGTITIRQTRLDSAVTLIQNSARTKNSFYFTFYIREVLTVWILVFVFLFIHIHFIPRTTHFIGSLWKAIACFSLSYSDSTSVRNWTDSEKETQWHRSFLGKAHILGVLMQVFCSF